MWSLFLIKRLAVILAASQIFVQPATFRTSFDPNKDLNEVVRIMNAGCSKITADLSAEFPDFKKLDIDQLLESLKTKPGKKSSAAIDILEIKSAYLIFCKQQPWEAFRNGLIGLVNYYNDTLKDLPDAGSLKTLRFPNVIQIRDSNGKPFFDVAPDGARRIFVRLDDIPPALQNAILAAEDKHFFEHHGVDEHGLIRAGLSSMNGGHEGGSTITQQLAKNLLVGSDLTFERKIREMAVAEQMERVLTKKQILEIYLNFVFFGRASWGVEMASESYFGKPVSKLTAVEAAFLAGLPKGPAYYNPDIHPDRALDRTNYVLSQMKENAVTQLPSLTTYLTPRPPGGFYFLDELARRIKKETLSGPVTSTLHPALQASVDAALQEGLARYELRFRRARWSGPEGRLSEVEGFDPHDWTSALRRFRAPLYDVHWRTAAVVSLDPGRARVGFEDGRTVPLTVWDPAILRRLNVYDVVMVREGPNAAELRFRPSVQGAALVMESGTGRVIALTGGFSHALSPLDRATQTARQPGSAMKPATYLAALNAGYQPNTLVPDAAVTLAPIDRGGQYWSPDNYDRENEESITTLRRGLENSKNRVTARLLEAIGSSPQEGLDRVLTLIRECGAHSNPPRQYAVILGALDVTMLDLTTCYATFANLGYRPQPHFFELGSSSAPLTKMTGADDVSFFQLRSLLQGVVARGTAYRLSTDLADLTRGRPVSDGLAVKSGTSQEANDAWMVGFTNAVTIAVWVGYDNQTGRTTLGDGATGATVAEPIFESILRAVALEYPLRPFDPPPPALHIVQLPIEIESGQVVQWARSGDLQPGLTLENFRVDSRGQIADTSQNIVQSSSWQQAGPAFFPNSPWRWRW